MMINKLKNIGIFKLLLWFGLFNVLIFSILAFYAFFHVEKPDAGREAFYAGSQTNIPDNQNFAIALAGLNAPAGADIIKHGRFVVNTTWQKLKDGEAKKIIDAAGKLDFVGTSEELECWIPSAESFTDEKCASSERIKILLVENKELLNRYKNLYNLPNWQGVSGNGQYVINLNKLISAEIMLDLANGNADSAYTKWRDNHLFINRVFKQDSTMIDRAIFLVVDGINLASVENILFQSPEIATTHYEELNGLLKANKLERYNLKAMLRAEYMLFNNELFIKNKNDKAMNIDYIKNRLYRFQLDFLNRAQLPPSTYDKSKNEMNVKYELNGNIFNFDWLNPLQSVLANMLISGQSRGFNLVKSMHSKDALIKLLNLSIHIRQQKIPEENIQTFLNNAGSQYYNPFTNKPMEWDAVRNVIYVANPFNPEAKVEVRI